MEVVPALFSLELLNEALCNAPVTDLGEMLLQVQGAVLGHGARMLHILMAYGPDEPGAMRKRGGIIISTGGRGLSAFTPATPSLRGKVGSIIEEALGLIADFGRQALHEALGSSVRARIIRF